MKLLITGAFQDAKEHIADLEKMGNTVFFLQMEQDELPCSYEDVEGVICNGLFLHHPIEKFTNLKYIQLTSAGFDRVPMEYIKKHQIEIHNARGVYSIPMAEFALAGVLNLYKGSRAFFENQKDHAWVKQRNLVELYGKCVGILGCGSVGTECAKRFKAFGCQVFGVDVVSREDASYDEILLMEKLPEILRKVDILIVTVPLMDSTRGLIGKQEFESMKPNALLVNIARGPVVCEEALIQALENHVISGAVLDVFENEPLEADSPLWEMENIVLTPHNSFVGEGNAERFYQVVLNNLLDKTF